MKKWFTMKSREGDEVVFFTDKLVNFMYSKGRNTTTITTTEGVYEFEGDQRYSIGLAIGKLYGRND